MARDFLIMLMYWLSMLFSWITIAVVPSLITLRYKTPTVPTDHVSEFRRKLWTLSWLPFLLLITVGMVAPIVWSMWQSAPIRNKATVFLNSVYHLESMNEVTGALLFMSPLFVLGWVIAPPVQKLTDRIPKNTNLGTLKQIAVATVVLPSLTFGLYFGASALSRLWQSG